MLYVVERINRECGSDFDFVVNSIFPELVQCLEENCENLFFAGDPEIFHRRYSDWLKFIDQLKLLLSKSTEENFYQSESYRTFSSKWDLLVYYQIRFQQISTKIEEILLERTFDLNEKEANPFRTLLCSTFFQSIETCWKDDFFLPSLAHRFWKLTLQCIVRFRTSIENFEVKTKKILFWGFVLFLYERLSKKYFFMF